MTGYKTYLTRQQEKMREAMLVIGIFCNDIMADGKLHRFGKNNNCWYIFFGSAGVFGDWSRNLHIKWRDSDNAILSPDERRQLNSEIAEARRIQDEKDQARVQKSQAQWNQRKPLSGTPAADYLAGRAIKIHPVSLGFMPQVYNFTTGKKHPALIAAIQNAERKVTGLQAIFLTNEAQKISGEGVEAKLIFGIAKGGAVRLAPLSDKLVLTEGVEDGLSILQSCPEYCVWACLGTSGLTNIIIPETVRQVIIAADNDEAGIVAAKKLAIRLKQQGLIVSMVLPQHGKDFNDLLCGRV